MAPRRRGQRQGIQQPTPFQRKMNDPAFRRYVTLGKEAHSAFEKMDFRQYATKQLEAILAAPSVWEDMRWELFCGYSHVTRGNSTEITAARVLPTTDDRNGLLRIVNNEEEPIFFRAYAANLLANWFMSGRTLNEEFAETSARTCLSLIEELSVSEGQRRMKNVLHPLTPITETSLLGNGLSFARDETIELILQQVKRECHEMLDWINDADRKAMAQERERRVQANPTEYVMDVMKEAGLSSETRAEFAEFMLTYKNNPFQNLEGPKITSEIIRRIQSFPVKDVAFFVRKDVANSDLSTEMQHRMGILSTGATSTEGYRVFKFDRERYLSGSRNATKIFRFVSITMCSHQETRPKHLLSALSHACQKPSPQFIPDQVDFTKKIDPYRPCTVLFETQEDATHPQILNLLGLMGYSSDQVGVLDAEAQELLTRKLPEVTDFRKFKLVDEKKKPYLSDLLRDKKCGNCGAVGPQLKVCSCGKAYYCNRTCLRVHWKAHKKEHEAAIAKKKNKKGNAE